MNTALSSPPPVRPAAPSAAATPHVLVCGSDDGYAMPLAVTLHTALKHSPPGAPLEVYVLDAGISPQSRARLTRAAAKARPDASLHWCEVDAQTLEKLPEAGYWSRGVYLRLLMDRFIPPERPRAVYIDCDTLIRGDLTPLYTADLGGRTVGAARDFVNPNRHDLWKTQEHRDALPVGNGAYFNSGVMVIDLPRWRSADIGNRAVDFAAGNAPLVIDGCDQCALNVVLDGDWTAIDPMWNACAHLLYLERYAPHEYRAQLLQRRSEIHAASRIVHFAGMPKPWHHWSTHPYTGDWVAALLRCGWFTPAEAAAWAARRLPYRLWLHVRLITGITRAVESTRSI